MKENFYNKTWFEILTYVVYVAFVFYLCFYIGDNILMKNCPDEVMRYPIAQYMSSHWDIPDGYEPSLINSLYGFSYTFFPFLAQIFSGFIMRIASVFTTSDHAMLTAARMASAFFISGNAIMSILIARKLFYKQLYRWLFITTSSLLPQMLFLGGYINNDSLALFSAGLIIYAWLLGFEKDWSWSCCIFLAISISMCFLSYYNAYGFILCSAFVFCLSCYFKRMTFKEFILKALIIFLIVLVLAGWFFIRNAILYNGDIFGMTTQRVQGELYAEDFLKPSHRGENFARKWSIAGFLFTEGNWVFHTVRSFIGHFGMMNLAMPSKYMVVYFIIISIAIIGFIYFIIEKRSNVVNNKTNCLDMQRISEFQRADKWIFYIFLCISIIIPIILSLYYSYFCDFQPQGRYIMSIAVPLFYFLVLGLINLTNALFKHKFIKNIFLSLIITYFLIAPIPISNYIVTMLSIP